MKNQELEVKFYIENLPRIQAGIEALGSILVQARILETNLRFDTPSGDLTRAFQVLRLRQDSTVHLTFKGPAVSYEGARLRQEIEFMASDFQAAKDFLEALGYQVQMVYEKYRAVYDFENVHITLDEMPYGNFVELEGEDPTGLKNVCQKIGLDWDAQVILSYSALFDQLKNEQNYSFRDLTFQNFSGLRIEPDNLHVKPAD
jgi:adenylate cyclase, class 2